MEEDTNRTSWFLAIGMEEREGDEGGMTRGFDGFSENPSFPPFWRERKLRDGRFQVRQLGPAT